MLLTVYVGLVIFVLVMVSAESEAWDYFRSQRAPHMCGPIGCPEPAQPPEYRPAAVPVAARCPAQSEDYRFKIAYGQTFGTCTILDYTTFEMSRRVAVYPSRTYLGTALGEFQVAMLGSFISYNEGVVEKVKQLKYEDGFELAWMPKSRLTFQPVSCGLNPYMETGAGIGYVTETYRNSGSRWNWSLMAGFGLERNIPGFAIFGMGVQWRHMSNGNMWGEGDELHHSNSGTDMLQGLITLLHRF
jgi:hypothetical protein